MQINTKILSTSNEQLIERLLNINKANSDSTPLMIAIVGAGGKTHLSYWLADFFKQRGQRVAITTTTKMYLPESDRFDNQLNLSEVKRNNTDIDDITVQTPSTTFIYQAQLPRTTVNAQIKVKGVSQQTLQTIVDSAQFTVLIIEADGAKHLPIKAPAEHEPCIPNASQVVIGVTGAEAIFAKASSHNIHRWQEFSALTHCLADMQIDRSILKALLEDPQGMFKGTPQQAIKIWVINKYDLAQDANRLQQLATDLLTDLADLNSIWLTQLNRSPAINRVLKN